jgi:phosphohistidine phosphatase
MKRLTILRHAKSSWSDPALTDFDRPLNGRGRHSAPEMGRRLKARGEMPDLVVSSPARRAISTARMACREMGFPESRIIEERGLYLAGAGQIMGIVRSLETLAAHLMIVGHNPGLTDFANDLSDARIDNLVTASLFVVEFDLADWSELAPGTGRFVYYDFPRNERGEPYRAGDFGAA